QPGPDLEATGIFRASDYIAAYRDRPLSHAGQSVTRPLAPVVNPSVASTVSVVRHQNRQVLRGITDCDGRFRLRTRMSQHVGQRFLQDPVRSAVDRLWQGPTLAVDRQGDSRPGRSDRSDEFFEPVKTGRASSL